MKRLFDITRYPGIVAFMLAGISIVIVAFASYNLLQMGMANLRFIGEHGWFALQSGGLIQFLQILVLGVISLFFFIVFKICESDLMARYRHWKDT